MIIQQRRAKLLAWPETRPPYLLSFSEKLFKVKVRALVLGCHLVVLVFARTFPDRFIVVDGKQWAALQGITLDRLRTSLGLTVLHIALVKGKAEAVRWLLEA